MSERIATQRGDVFDVLLARSRATYVAIGFYTDLSIEALRVFPDSMRVANRPTKVPRIAAIACELDSERLSRVRELTASYRDEGRLVQGGAA